MATLPADATCEKRNGEYVFTLPAPNLSRDRVFLLNTDGAEHLGQRLGQKPSRATLFRWRTSGYPVVNHGPLVVLPTTTVGRRPHTSIQALSLFLETITALSGQIDRAGSITEWEERYGRRYLDRR